jgi:ribonuclease VapC
MFIDSSAIVAVMTLEDDAVALLEHMMRAQSKMINAAVFWEVTVNLAKKRRLTISEANHELRDFLDKFDIEIAAIPPEAGFAAVEAYDRFGKGRHPASLNFGDCLSYACAKVLKQPLLFKGDDFAQTDVVAV